MTGTAMTEEEEFRNIYRLDVVEIPTNKECVRFDHNDHIYKNESGKFTAAIRQIEECHEKGQPVLVGTISIEKSEYLSKLLKKKKIPHEVLNAKNHAREAEIVAQAGKKDAVTIATNMAGRGTDIMLGDGVREVGGLKVIGTERHESRRIDNQLRGRSGRQGDPGESRFFLSAEDDLLRLFGGDRIKNVLSMMKMDEDDVIEHGLITKSIENAQKKVEGNNFGIRKHLLQYDQVMNEQREIIYTQRDKVIAGADLRDNIMNMLQGVIGRAVDTHITDENAPEEWDITGLNKELFPIFHENFLDFSPETLETITKQEIKEKLYDEAAGKYYTRELEIQSERMREIERVVMMSSVDKRWMDHIDEMDQMRQGISLRSIAQRDPLVEYKFASYDMFEDMSNNIQRDTIFALFNVSVSPQQEPEMKQSVDMDKISTNSSEKGPQVKKPTRRTEEKIGRNDPCPCGSGRKYKQCCMK
jgi:preprotein translocase subunit SecA